MINLVKEHPYFGQIILYRIIRIWHTFQISKHFQSLDFDIIQFSKHIWFICQILQVSFSFICSANSTNFGNECQIVGLNFVCSISKNLFPYVITGIQYIEFPGIIGIWQ